MLVLNNFVIMLIMLISVVIGFVVGIILARKQHNTVTIEESIQKMAIILSIKIQIKNFIE